MATIAQGLQAGQLAAGIQALQSFAQQLQTALAANETIFSVTIGMTGTTPPIQIQVAMNATDSATVINGMVPVINGLITEWTNELEAL
jgi:hypothetical protein